MVGIFKYECGLKFYAVSENEESAIKALYERFDHTGFNNPMEWWKKQKEWNCGAPCCFEIKEIKVI